MGFWWPSPQKEKRRTPQTSQNKARSNRKERGSRRCGQLGIGPETTTKNNLHHKARKVGCEINASPNGCTRHPSSRIGLGPSQLHEQNGQSWCSLHRRHRLFGVWSNHHDQRSKQQKGTFDWDQPINPHERLRSDRKLVYRHEYPLRLRLLPQNIGNRTSQSL